MNKTIEEIRQIDDKENIFKECIEESNKSQETVNAFVTIMDKYECFNENGSLAGVPYALKDNFSTKGILTTGSSNILSDYVPVFDSTVYKKLKESGAVLVGKTVLDELAMGGSGLTGHTGIVRNPWNLECIPGGSSAGSGGR